jgi:hypothetical protein
MLSSSLELQAGRSAASNSLTSVSQPTRVRKVYVAFAATDPDGMRKRLQSKNAEFREQIVPRTGDRQFFLYDPDGVGVEMNFPKP